MATAETRRPMPEEVTSSMAGVWKRYTDQRPTGASTEIRGNVVRCSIPDSVRTFDEALAESEEGHEDRLRSYRRAATSAVSRSTHCRVVGMITQRDEDTDVTCEIFVLDSTPDRPAFGQPGWIVS